MITTHRRCAPRLQGKLLARSVRLSILCLALLANPLGSSVRGQTPSTPAEPEQQPVEPAFTPPGKRKAIQGMGSITGRSNLVFPSAPDQAYQLEFTYVFPDRVRWLMAPRSKQAADSGEGKGRLRRSQQDSLVARASRRLMYRFGTGAWTIEPGKTSSIPYEGDAYRITLLQFELRRCALIWPGDFSWKEDGQLRRTKLKDLGILEVELDKESGLPTLMRSSDLDGTLREELKAMQWEAAEADAKAKSPRAPKSWQLHAGGRHIWTEEFQNLRRGLRYNDSFFRPFDRRKNKVKVSSPDDGVERIELPEVSVWREDLTPESLADWDVALKQARAAIESWKPQFEGTDMVLDDRPAFLLDPEGKPLRLELRLKAVADYPPARWFKQWGMPALRQVRVGVEGLDSNLIQRISRRAGKSILKASPILVVQLTENGAGVTQLIIPLIE